MHLLFHFSQPLSHFYQNFIYWATGPMLLAPPSPSLCTPSYLGHGFNEPLLLPDYFSYSLTHVNMGTKCSFQFIEKKTNWRAEWTRGGLKGENWINSGHFFLTYQVHTHLEITLILLLIRKAQVIGRIQ